MSALALMDKTDCKEEIEMSDWQYSYAKKETQHCERVRAPKDERIFGGSNICEVYVHYVHREEV